MSAPDAFVLGFCTCLALVAACVGLMAWAGGRDLRRLQREPEPFDGAQDGGRP